MVPEERRAVVFDDAERPVEARILWRPSLAAGTEIVGPTVIEEPNSTILVGPRDHVLVNESGHIIVTLAERE
jgi:N-methylhydantoinase A